MDALPYLLAFLPLGARLLVGIRFSGYMLDQLPEEAVDRTGHRTLLIGVSALSYAGLFALAAIPGNLSDRKLPLWFMFVSTLAVLAALNAQGYKVRRWHDWAADSLYEVSTLCLLASVTSLLLLADLPIEFQLACLSLAALTWSFDFLIRLRFTISDLEAKEKRDGLAS